MTPSKLTAMVPLEEENLSEEIYISEKGIKERLDLAEEQVILTMVLCGCWTHLEGHLAQISLITKYPATIRCTIMLFGVTFSGLWISRRLIQHLTDYLSFLLLLFLLVPVYGDFDSLDSQDDLFILIKSGLKFNLIGEILLDCQNVLEQTANKPKAALEAQKFCRIYQLKIMALMKKKETELGLRDSDVAEMSFLKAVISTVLLLGSFHVVRTQNHLYRDSVFLLRDLCADIKIQLQLRNMTRAMAKLNQEFGSSEALDDLHSNNYFVVAYIRADCLRDVEHSKLRLLPARLKLDTGSDYDLVSYEFLVTSLGLSESAFDAIPKEQQEEISGFNGKTYTPEFGIELHWSRDVNTEQRKHYFLIVHNCPAEVILGYRGFLAEASVKVKRALTVVAPRKSREQREREKKAEEERLKQQAQRDAEQLQKAKEARSAKQPSSGTT
ncbi:hypothetical protein FSARC_13939 [Fusarium sarcochroum]|uniref:Uncharacterized protein n=1 Tax=Fusarium sarcochroum TaxID=1208366 RepID=A0A8H4WQY0_9HYPO|nr:hypothetical protein FSARC_13939 [Fusarium sarcochroum]